MSMKKSGKALAFVLAIAFILTFTLSACGSKKATVKKNNTEQSTAGAGDTSDTNNSGKDVLVVYFSATGTTKGVAKKIANITDNVIKLI